jgi:hypothetical protein
MLFHSRKLSCLLKILAKKFLRKKEEKGRKRKKKRNY